MAKRRQDPAAFGLITTAQGKELGPQTLKPPPTGGTCCSLRRGAPSPLLDKDTDLKSFCPFTVASEKGLGDPAPHNQSSAFLPTLGSVCSCLKVQSEPGFLSRLQLLAHTWLCWHRLPGPGSNEIGLAWLLALGTKWQLDSLVP